MTHIVDLLNLDIQRDFRDVVGYNLILNSEMTLKPSGTDAGLKEWRWFPETKVTRTTVGDHYELQVTGTTPYDPADRPGIAHVVDVTGLDADAVGQFLSFAPTVWRLSSTPFTWQLAMAFYDSAENWLGGYETSGVYQATTGGDRETLTGPIPAGTVQVQGMINFFGATKDDPPPAGFIANTAQWRATVSPVSVAAAAADALNYVTGDTLPLGYREYEWEGEPFESITVDYKTATRTTRNLVPNPSFETNLDGVFAARSSLNRSSAIGRALVSGEWAMMIRATGEAGGALVAQDVPLASEDAGSWLGILVHIGRSTGGTHRQVVASFYDEGSQFISGGSINGPVLPLSNSTVPPSRIAGVIPASARRARLNIYVYGDASSAAAPAGNTLTDAWLSIVAPTEAEALAAVADYWDGDTPDTYRDTFTWDGVPHASTSRRRRKDWQPYLAGARSVNSRRGGQREGVSARMDVGLLTTTLLDGGDPASDPRIRPGASVRLSTADTDEAIFTGALQDIQTTYGKDLTTRVMITAADAVQTITNTPRYGAVTTKGMGAEPWANRVRRLATSATTPMDTPPAVALPSVYSPSGSPAWSSGQTVVNIFSEINESYVPAAAKYPKFDAWVLRVHKNYTYPGNEPIGMTRFQVHRPWHPTSGLTPGKRYLYVIYAFHNMNMGAERAPLFYPSLRLYHRSSDVYSPNQSVGKGPDNATPLSFTFTAETATDQMGVTIGDNNDGDVVKNPEQTYGTDTGSLSWLAVSLGRPVVYELPDDPFLLQDVVYESTLAAHLDLACDSVGAAWFVDREGVIQVARDRGQGTGQAHFTDVRGPDPALVYYTELELSFDTRNMVTEVEFSQHGQKFAPDENAYHAQDYSQAITATAAAAEWGKRLDSVDTSLLATGAYSDALQERAEQLFATSATPDRSPSLVRFLATDYLALATSLEVWDQITVTARGTDYDCRIYGIEHEVESPAQWFVYLTLGAVT